MKKLLRVWRLIAAAALMALALTAGAAAAEFPCGDGVTASLEGGVLTLRGVGMVTDGWGWAAQKESITALVVEQGVTVLGDELFMDCTALESVALPESLQAVGCSAFENCTALAAVELPEGVTSVAQRAFYGCTALRSIRFPSTLRSLEKEVLAGCGLEQLILPEKAAYIDEGALRDCKALKDVAIPVKVRLIGKDAFAGCDQLATVSFNGGRGKWDGIKVDKGNEALTQAEVYCYGGVSRNFAAIAALVIGMGMMYFGISRRRKAREELGS